MEVTVRNRVTGEERVVKAPVVEAVLSVYAEEQGDREASSYRERYGELVRVVGVTVMVGDWYASS